MYLIAETDATTWTVGYYTPGPAWVGLVDLPSLDEAIAMAARLNGFPTAVPPGKAAKAPPIATAAKKP